MAILHRLIFVGIIFFLAACSEQSSEEHIIAARQHVEAQNMNAAVLELKNAIQKDSRSSAARFELGRIYAEQGRFESAEKELNRALELGHNPADVLPLLSLAYQRTGAQNALAELDYSQSGLGAPQAAKVGFYKLLALVDLGKLEEAKLLIDELSQLDTSSVYRGLANTYRLILDEDFAAALAETKELRAQSPGNEDVLKLLTRLHLGLQQREEALAVFEELQRVNPNDLVTTFTYLALLMDMARFETAEPIIDRLLEFNAENGLLNQFKGIVLASQEKYDAALEYLGQAILNGRDNNIVRLLSGYSAYRTEKYADAVRHLTLLVDVLPSDHPALRVLADSQLLLGQNQEASQILSKIEGDGTQDATLFSRAGYQLIREGDIDNAREMVSRGNEIGASPEDLLRLGVLQLSLNDVSGLIKLEQAVEQAPDSTLTRQTLASAYLLANELDKAETLAQEWKQNQPQNMSPYLLAGEIAQKQGNLALAKENYSEAQKLAPDAPEPKLAMVNLLIGEQKTEQALQEVGRIVEQHPDSALALSINYLLARNAQTDTDSVLSSAQASLEQFPDSLQLRLAVANIALDKGLNDQVITALEPITPQRNTPNQYWALRGQALLRSNKLDEALEHFTLWRSFSPYNKDATLGALLILDGRREFEDALAITESFSEQRSDTQIDILKAYFLVILARTEDSRAIVSGLPQALQEQPFVRGIKARIALQDNRFADAAGHAEVAYNNAANLRNLLVLVNALERSNQGEKAFSELQSFTQNNPSDPRVRLLLAERLINRDKPSAIALYEQTVAELPNNMVVLNNLAYLYYEQGELDKAEPLARKAVELQPSRPEIVDTLAQIYVAKNDLESARELYETVINMEVGSDEVVINFISLLMKMGDEELAQRRARNRDWQTPEAKAEAQALVAKS